ncbi:MAG: serine--tRNA ligase [Patescibacteria group bacterium]
MLDIRLIRENSDLVKESLIKRNKDSNLVDQFLDLDEKWRSLTTSMDKYRAEQNVLSKERKIEESKSVKEKIKSLNIEMLELERKRNDLLNDFPNIVASDVPVGKNELENVVLREVGVKPTFDFKPKDYLLLAENLDIIDVKRAVRVSGSRFGYLKGKAALLELALVRFAFSKLIAKGFTPIIPPVMIRPEVFAGMGRLAADQKEERYFLEKDNLYLVGSAEHTLGPLHMDETLRDRDLPKRYVGLSTCFRREAGSYGKDTKGILRVHQFDKVEMFSFSKPEESEKEHQFLLSCQEELMRDLGLCYRVMQICTGDLGWTDAKQYDIEVWLPGQNQYRETHSCSNTTDFQARGINCKYEKGGYAHMLNATALAIGRIIIAIIENYQNSDGDFAIPEVLEE